MVNSGNDTVAEISPTGSVSTPITGLNNPNGITFDDLNDMYLAEGNTIVRISPSGDSSIFATGVDNDWELVATLVTPTSVPLPPTAAMIALGLVCAAVAKKSLGS